MFPDTGNQCRVTAKTQIKIMPSQKPGVAHRRIELTIEPSSNFPPRLNELMAANTYPIKKARMKVDPIKSRVQRIRLPIKVVTDCEGNWYEIPKYGGQLVKMPFR